MKIQNYFSAISFSLAIFLSLHTSAFAAPKITLTPSMVTNESGVGNAGSLVDEQTLAGDPANSTGGAVVTKWFPGWNSGTYPASAIIDLGQDYLLSQLSFYDSNGTGNVSFSVGSPGAWTSVLTNGQPYYLVWSTFSFVYQTRYVRVTIAGSGAQPNEIVIYGDPVATPTPSPSPSPTPTPEPSPTPTPEPSPTPTPEPSPTPTPAPSPTPTPEPSPTATPAAALVPSAPTGVSAALYTASSIVLNWTDSSPSITTGFKIERSLAGSGIYSGVANVSSATTSYVDSDSSLVAGKLYFYKIRAFNWLGESVDSPFVNQPLPPIAGDTPAAPTLLSAQLNNTSVSKVDLSWTDNSGGIATYAIERASYNGAFSQIATTLAGATSYTDSGLSSNLAFFYRIRAYNGSTYSSYSPIVYRRIPGVLNGPVTPGNLIAVPTSDSTVALTWTQEPTVNTGYEIWRSTSATGTYSLVGSVSSSAALYTDTGLTSGSTYYYKVKSTNSSGASGLTKYAYATPKAIANLRMFLIYVDLSFLEPDTTSPSFFEQQFPVWVYVPASYYSGSSSYPLLVFHHGDGEKGTNPNLLINASGSIPNVLYNQTAFNPEAIVVMPQLDYNRTSFFSQLFSDAIVRGMSQLYRIDLKKISMTGLSGGSGRTMEYARAYYNNLVGFSLVSYAPPSVPLKQVELNGYAGLQQWAFANQTDPVVGTGSFCGYLTNVGYLASGTGSNFLPCGLPLASPVPANVKGTVYLGVNSHDAWTRAYSTSNTWQNPNFWQWLVSLTK